MTSLTVILYIAGQPDDPLGLAASIVAAVVLIGGVYAVGRRAR